MFGLRLSKNSDLRQVSRLSFNLEAIENRQQDLEKRASRPSSANLVAIDDGSFAMGATP